MNADTEHPDAGDLGGKDKENLPLARPSTKPRMTVVVPTSPRITAASKPLIPLGTPLGTMSDKSGSGAGKTLFA